MCKLINQMLKFGVVGFVAFIIDYGVLMLLSQLLGMNPVVAGGISYTISLVFNYLASMRYVFKHRDNLSRRKEFLIFVILSTIGFFLNELILWIGIHTVGTSALAVSITKVVSTAIVMVWNFVSRKMWLDAG